MKGESICACSCFLPWAFAPAAPFALIWPGIKTPFGSCWQQYSFSFLFSAFAFASVLLLLPVYACLEQQCLFFGIGVMMPIF
ncbi:MAG: hypothetical protein IJN53_05260 [Oscillospiraceae bacterium]|nr:hypothetical protein [Oscillospiraceae bacterium]